ncbi:MAG: DUF3073 domain-containing protein [Propionibacteriales bacterium]|nr:DUF3073 domain-containing protein [Propionibacteriales bacterium]
MGRGRAKAKQTKVARELKYRNYDTDFSELQRELHGGGDGELRPAVEPSVESGDPPTAYDDRYDESEAAPQR